MNRIPFGYSNAIAAGLQLIPQPIVEAVHVDWFCGSDPVFAGLHSDSKTPDGRYYAEAAHFLKPSVSDLHCFAPTIVLPQPEEPWVIVHEFGHAVDHFLGGPHFRVWPVTKYAESNYAEAFAEAFAAWVGVLVYVAGGCRDRLFAQDAATVAFFEAISA